MEKRFKKKFKFLPPAQLVLSFYLSNTSSSIALNSTSPSHEFPFPPSLHNHFGDSGGTTISRFFTFLQKSNLFIFKFNSTLPLAFVIVYGLFMEVKEKSANFTKVDILYLENSIKKIYIYVRKPKNSRH